MRKEPRKQWKTPEIRTYGTFESMTQVCDKTFGSNDGFTFQGQAIVCAS